MALIEAIDAPALCQRYGEAGRARVEKYFSVTNAVLSYEQLWAGILGLRLPKSEIGSHTKIDAN
jgi:hypothetical protein